MGDASKRKKATDAWLASLTPDEVHLAQAADRLWNRFILRLGATGMCYRMSFFLTAYMKAEHSIDVTPVVGWVNDGDTDLMASHAWIETSGGRTDLTLGITDHPDVQLPGAVLVVGRVIKPGVPYSYHRARGAEALKALAMMNADPMLAPIVAEQELQHLSMVARSKSMELQRAYLDEAPDGFDYEKLAGIVRA
jgi:hypothetical protein